MSAKSRRNRNRLPIIVLGVAVTLCGVGAVALVRSFLKNPPAEPKPVVQVIHLIRPPPPPPDLPPPPPPPPEEKVNIPQDKPDPTPSNEPPPGQLGLDAAGSAGGMPSGWQPAQAAAICSLRGAAPICGMRAFSRTRSSTS